MVAGLDGLCAPVRDAPHRLGPHSVRERDLRYDPPETAEARRARQNQRPAHQDRLRFGLPIRPGISAAPRQSWRVPQAPRQPDGAAAARQCAAKPSAQPEKQSTLSTEFEARPRHPQSRRHKPDLQIAPKPTSNCVLA